MLEIHGRAFEHADIDELTKVELFDVALKRGTIKESVV